MKKVLKRILIILLGLAVLVVLHTGFYHISLRDFRSQSVQEFHQPDLYTVFDEQGIAYDEESGLFLFSGYMRGTKSPSPVYLVDKNLKTVLKKINLCKEDGSDLVCHCGGIAVHDNLVFLAGSTDCCLYIYDKSEILESADNGRVLCKQVFSLHVSDQDKVRASFVGVSDDGMLYVGEFYHPLIPSLRGIIEHSFHPSSGKSTYSILVGFPFDASSKFGIQPEPAVVYRLPEYVQGVTSYKNTLVLSRSFAMPRSKLEYYALDEAFGEGSTTVLGCEVPLYRLPEQFKTIKCIPMNECLAVADDRVYIANELANMPIIGWILPIGAEWCYSVPCYTK